jgi:hypothetical protein
MLPTQVPIGERCTKSPPPQRARVALLQSLRFASEPKVITPSLARHRELSRTFSPFSLLLRPSPS